MASSARMTAGLVVDQGAGDGHALHLSAGHLVGLVLQAVAQADGHEGVDGAAAAFGGADRGVVHQGQLDVLHRRGFRQQVVVLEDEADFAVAQHGALGLRHGAHAGAVQQVFAAGGGVEAAQRVEQGRFARARGAHDGDELALVDGERHAAQGVHRLVAHLEVAADVVKFDDCFAHIYNNV